MYIYVYMYICVHIYIYIYVYIYISIYVVNAQNRRIETKADRHIIFAASFTISNLWKCCSYNYKWLRVIVMY